LGGVGLCFGSGFALSLVVYYFKKAKSQCLALGGAATGATPSLGPGRKRGREERGSDRATGVPAGPWLELRRLPQILSPCSFLLWILTHKRFHSNLAIAPTCDTVSTYHITDKARDPQRGLSRATYLLKVSRRAPVACRPQCRGRGRRRSKRSADQRGRSASRDGKRDGGR